MTKSFTISERLHRASRMRALNVPKAVLKCEQIALLKLRRNSRKLTTGPLEVKALLDRHVPD